MNDTVKNQVLVLKRQGKGYKAIARETGTNINTVKSLCRRSGLFRDNPEHRALFTLPELKYSTALAIPKPLPPQQVITGHKQTDAYLWVLEVIKTGEPAHIAAAEDALEKLTITPKQAQERYTRYLQAQGAGWTAAFSTMWLDNPQHFISNATSQRAEACWATGYFGSLPQAFDPVPAEKLIENRYGPWQEIYTEYTRKGEGEYNYSDVLPAPHTLSDVVREFLYWDWLSGMRSAAGKELYPDAYSHESTHLYEREGWLEMQLETIRPVSRKEALDVLKWYLSFHLFEGMNGQRDEVFINLIGDGFQN